MERQTLPPLNTVPCNWPPSVDYVLVEPGYSSLSSEVPCQCPQPPPTPSSWPTSLLRTFWNQRTPPSRTCSTSWPGSARYEGAPPTVPQGCSLTADCTRFIPLRRVPGQTSPRPFVPAQGPIVWVISLPISPSDPCFQTPAVTWGDWRGPLLLPRLTPTALQSGELGSNLHLLCVCEKCTPFPCQKSASAQRLPAGGGEQ